MTDVSGLPIEAQIAANTYGLTRMKKLVVKSNVDIDSPEVEKINTEIMGIPLSGFPKLKKGYRFRVEGIPVVGVCKTDNWDPKNPMEGVDMGPPPLG